MWENMMEWGFERTSFFQRERGMVMNIRKNIRVVRELVRLRFQNVMMFRLGFFGPFFVDGSLFLVQLLVFEAVYGNVEQIGGWGKGEMILYIGTFSLLNAVNMVVYFFGVIGIPGKIKSGEMDLYLAKPVSPLLRLTFESINPGSVPLVIMSVVIIMYGAVSARVVWNLQVIAGYSFWVLLMLVLYYDMEVLIRSISFFVISTAKLERIEEAGIEICMQLPGTVYYGIYKLIFCVILPYGIMATIPVKSLIGECDLQVVIYGVFMVLIFSLLTGLVWKMGIRKYNSASS